MIVDIRIYRLRRLNECLVDVRNTREDAEFLVQHYEALVTSCRDEEDRLVAMIREIEENEGACIDVEVSSDV